MQLYNKQYTQLWNCCVISCHMLKHSIIAGDVKGGLICNVIPTQTRGLSVEHTHQHTQKDQHMGVVDRRGRSQSHDSRFCPHWLVMVGPNYHLAFFYHHSSYFDHRSQQSKIRNATSNALHCNKGSFIEFEKPPLRSLWTEPLTICSECLELRSKGQFFAASDNLIALRDHFDV